MATSAPRSSSTVNSGVCAELGDVGEDRHLHRVGERRYIASSVIASGKIMSAPASTQAHGAVDRGVEPFDGQRVGARHDHEVRVGARVDRGLDAVDHLLLRRRSPCPGGGRSAWRRPGPRCASPPAPALISDLHGARDVEGARAEAGVDVDQQRQVADVGDAADVGEHVVEGADAEVGQAERAGGDAAAGEVDRAGSRRARPAARGRR